MLGTVVVFIAVVRCFHLHKTVFAAGRKLFVGLFAESHIQQTHSSVIVDSENNVDTIYLGSKNELIDINYLIEQFAQKSKCDIRVQGALNDKAVKHFKGFIDFKEGASQSIGKENENCTLLSDKAISRSLPVLLCHEEDVEGAHGVSTGKIDENKLFYIMTKGIPYDDAKKLIVKANFSKIVRDIPYENLQSLIMKRVDKI